MATRRPDVPPPPLLEVVAAPALWAVAQAPGRSGPLFVLELVDNSQAVPVYQIVRSYDDLAAATAFIDGALLEQHRKEAKA